MTENPKRLVQVVCPTCSERSYLPLDVSHLAVCLGGMEVDHEPTAMVYDPDKDESLVLREWLVDTGRRAEEQLEDPITICKVPEGY